jgi:hypothetical protein
MIFRHFRFDLHALKDICPERDGENVCPACPKPGTYSNLMIKISQLKSAT